MQCWPQFTGGGVSLCQRGSRRVALVVQAKERTTIVQNHKRKSVWINIDYERLYTQPSYSPGRQVGPVKLKQLPGRGRGLVAEREVPLGEALLVCEPVGAAVTGPAGSEELQPRLLGELERMQNAGELGPADRARLRLLHDGSPAGSPTSLRNRAASLDDFRRLEDKLRRAAEAPKKPKGRGFGAASQQAQQAAEAAAAAPAIDMAALGEPLLSTEELLQLVLRNCWGNPTGDTAAARLRKEPLQAIIGVWPEFALLNHSCAPNTVVFNVGQHLLVQAARTIPSGGELTTSYLDSLVVAPLEERRRSLRGSYGFECACERCKAESSVPASVTAAVREAYELACSEEALALDEDREDVRGARNSYRELEEKLAAAVARMETAMEEAGLEEKLRVWLRASAHGALYRLAMIRDLPETGADLAALMKRKLQPGAGGGDAGRSAPFSDPAAPGDLAVLLEAVAPGSDSHLFLALEAFVRTAELYGRDDERTADATRACLRAHLTRYGRVSDGLLQALLAARTRFKHYLGSIIELDEEEGSSTGSSPAPGGSAVPLLGPTVAGTASEAQLKQAAAELAAGML